VSPDEVHSSFTCAQILSLSPDGPDSESIKPQAVTVSASFSVEVDACDVVAMGGVIDRLGRQALTVPEYEGGEAANSLSTMPVRLRRIK